MSSARAIVAGHGDFAAGLLSAVGQITGREDVFVGMTQHDLSAQDVEVEMGSLLASLGISVIFTDLPAGSCTMAARRLQRRNPEIVLVMGTNLATLLDFVFADDVSPAVAAVQAAEKGRAALVVKGGSADGGQA